MALCAGRATVVASDDPLKVTSTAAGVLHQHAPDTLPLVALLQHQLLTPVSRQAALCTSALRELRCSRAPAGTSASRESQALSCPALRRCCPGRRCLPECTGSAATKPQKPFWASAGAKMMSLRPVQGRCWWLHWDAGLGLCARRLCQRLSCHASLNLLTGRQKHASQHVGLCCRCSLAFHSNAEALSARALTPAQDVQRHPPEPAPIQNVVTRMHRCCTVCGVHVEASAAH